MTLDNVMSWCNWASHIRIMGIQKGKTVADPIIYSIKHVEEFKYDKLPLPETMETASREALCGVPHLEVGEEYFVGGFLSKDILRLEKCAQPYIEMYNGTGIGKAPPRWRSITEKNIKNLHNLKEKFLLNRKEL
ncbi:unnamed protein product [Bursaphelenchus xylophilus]|uniref:(pine wood nematode) hypothetical protein n=1 Tax=Bursaphelenchus xylophilus TaxID=6326 RepID=A0A1I7RSC6_BURXY|nr:unnamed protein product [Bursaphelenchus xylophilus]CAG9123048.1 unnamed protein product [Bursaphelenchus xylophilus]